MRHFFFMVWFFIFFLVSGFCSILYEIVWLRLAMAQFGVTSALTSIVLSMFMAGLGFGSWGSGRLIREYENRIKIPAIRLYALAELLIGISALLVPFQLLSGRKLLERMAVSSSAAYYLGSGIWLALTLIPWCACMGATIPLAMLAIRKWRGRATERESERSFSYLYLANILGALVGATIPLLLVELYGFRNTLKIGAACNSLLALSAVVLSMAGGESKPSIAACSDIRDSNIGKDGAGQMRAQLIPHPLVLLFLTGLTSLAMEVVWIRQFTPYLGTVVYAFASILATYLVSTFLGLQGYRIWSQKNRQVGRLIWALLGLFPLLSLVAANPNIDLPKLLRLAVGIAPFSGAVGFITPLLVDRWSGGDPARAGKAYALNILGCIFGPLLSGFLLLPVMSERWVLFSFSLPWLLIGLRPQSFPEGTRLRFDAQAAGSYAAVPLALALVFTQTSFEDQFGRSHLQRAEVLRDNTATIVAAGEGRNKILLINGVGITGLTPITKFMAHLPLAFLDHPPKSALDVCFGMGTTYRSLLSWDIPVTAVELVPSVPRVFGFFHADGSELLRSPLSHLVIDDGRRYLERTSEQYDVITIDPPPPVEAAGSSLLYSKEFYAIIKGRLRSGGILQQWLPGGDAIVRASVARALKESFQYVRVFRPGESGGYHFLASNRTLPDRTGAELAERLTPKAAHDFTEWGPESTPELQFADVLKKEISLDQIIAEAPHVPALQDDRPENEYYLLRLHRTTGKNTAIVSP
jgi:predicted membrane-bound spermidine synthase